MVQEKTLTALFESNKFVLMARLKDLTPTDALKIQKIVECYLNENITEGDISESGEIENNMLWAVYAFLEEQRAMIKQIATQAFLRIPNLQKDEQTVSGTLQIGEVSFKMQLEATNSLCGGLTTCSWKTIFHAISETVTLLFFTAESTISCIDESLNTEKLIRNTIRILKSVDAIINVYRAERNRLKSYLQTWVKVPQKQVSLNLQNEILEVIKQCSPYQFIDEDMCFGDLQIDINALEKDFHNYYKVELSLAGCEHRTIEEVVSLIADAMKKSEKIQDCPTEKYICDSIYEYLYDYSAIKCFNLDATGQEARIDFNHLIELLRKKWNVTY